MPSPAVSPIGVHHPGVVVSDLDRSIAFYRDMFGVEPLIRLEGLGGPEIAEMYELPEVEFALAILGFPSGNVELLAFTKPDDGHKPLPRSCDIGSGHIAIQVADVDEAIASLVARGMRTVAKPLHTREGSAAGMALAYGLDPDGNRIELIQLPG